MDWKQELLKRLDAVAAKLGTTTEYLWKVLVRQGYVEGITDVLSGVTCLVMTIVLYRFTVKWTKMKPGEHEWTEGQSACVWLGTILGLAFAVATSACLTAGIKELLNPEYFALREILQAIR